jgi:hypothetical protein
MQAVDRASAENEARRQGKGKFVMPRRLSCVLSTSLRLLIRGAAR